MTPSFTSVADSVYALLGNITWMMTMKFISPIYRLMTHGKICSIASLSFFLKKMPILSSKNASHKVGEFY